MSEDKHKVIQTIAVCMILAVVIGYIGHLIISEDIIGTTLNEISQYNP